MRDTFHLILSMPTRTDPLSVQRAARDFAKQEFSGVSVRDGPPHVRGRSVSAPAGSSDD